MAVGIVDRQKLVNIADAVREKTGIIFDMTLDDIASNITSMPSADNNAKFDVSVSSGPLPPGIPGSSSKLLLSYLTTVDLSEWDTSDFTDMSSMFNGCSSLTSLDASGFNTIMVTNMSNMFRRCESLTTLDLSNWNTSNVTDMGNMFSYCYNLYNLTLGTNWASNSNISSFDLSSCPLTRESALDVINKLATRSNSPVIKFSNQVGLYQSEIDVATNKGWSVSGCSVLVEDATTVTVGQCAIIDGVPSKCVYVADTPQDWGQRIFGSLAKFIDSNGNSTFQWGGNGTDTRIYTTTIGAGLTNTNALLAMNLKSTDGTPTIWDALAEFRSTYGDRWFIASRDEGFESYKQGMSQTWTSSEYDSSDAYITYENTNDFLSKAKVNIAFAFTYV